MQTKDNILNKKVGFISLGCDKNRVDLENIVYLITQAGFKTTKNLEEANIVIINTCSFIESARVESIDSILETANLKSLMCEKIIVTGCLNHMNYADLESSLPEVDCFVKVNENSLIVDKIFKLYGLDFTDCIPKCDFNRVLSTPKHYAYLKISEGCNNFCSYCTIPFIRGRFVSEPIENLVKEATALAKQGVKELILVGQDVTKYGQDLYGHLAITELLQKLSKIDGIEWIRLLYCYPELINDDLIAEIKNNPKVVKYVDLPLQHINSNILKQMNRRTDKNKILEIIHKLKEAVPNIAIRTTFILGFPGETEADFKEVLEFLNQEKLTNVGFFPYSREEGTRAYNFPNQVHHSTKNKRVRLAYQTQEKIVENNNNNLVNQILDVIIDEVNEDYYIGRSYLSAPEIDTVVYITKNGLVYNTGDIVPVKITEVLNYDLEGEIYESTK